MENNKLIAEFMGVNPTILGDEITYEMYGVIDCIEDGVDEQHFFLEEQLLFHTSWDWLMPVVEKIESFQDGEDGDSMRGNLYNFRIEQYFVYILDGESMDVIIEMNGDSKIDATYKAVVEFINEYNKNK